VEGSKQVIPSSRCCKSFSTAEHCDIRHRLPQFRQPSVLGMDNESEICGRYEAEMAVIASADRDYYLKEKPTSADRRAYAERKNQLDDLRDQLYAELSALRTKKPSRSETFTVSLEDKALNQHTSSEEMCSLRHNLLNYLSVALGRTQLLGEVIEDDPQARKHLAAILDSVNKITLCLRQQCPKDKGRRIGGTSKPNASRSHTHEAQDESHSAASRSIPTTR